MHELLEDVTSVKALPADNVFAPVHVVVAEELVTEKLLQPVMELPSILSEPVIVPLVHLIRISEIVAEYAA